MQVLFVCPLCGFVLDGEDSMYSCAIIPRLFFLICSKKKIIFIMLGRVIQESDFCNSFTKILKILNIFFTLTISSKLLDTVMKLKGRVIFFSH